MENTKIFYVADYQESIASSFAYYLRTLLQEDDNSCTDENIEQLFKKVLSHFLDSCASEGTDEEQFPIYKITVENIGCYQADLEYQAVGAFFQKQIASSFPRAGKVKNIRPF